MNDSSSDIPDKNNEQFSGDDSQKIPENKSPETISDGIFNIKISEDMALRNALRTGLVEAQGSNTEKIPMFVSWPHWLEDGIACMFVKDLHQLLDKAVQDVALSFAKMFEIDVESSVPEETIEKSKIKTLPQFENDKENSESETKTTTETEQKPITEMSKSQTPKEFPLEELDENPMEDFSSEIGQELFKEIKPDEE